MFRGTYEHPLDEKGRLMVPLRFREPLRAREDDRLVITNFVLAESRFLQAFSYEAWLKLEARLQARPQLDPTFMTFKHFYLGGAHECQIDKQGRVLIPPRLREYAGLHSSVVCVGDVDKFNIWDRGAYDKVFSAGEQLLMTNQSHTFLSEL